MANSVPAKNTHTGTNTRPCACRLRLIVAKVNSMGVTDGTIMTIIMIAHIAKIISRSAKPHARLAFSSGTPCKLILRVSPAKPIFAPLRF
jgi:hypothetical protein